MENIRETVEQIIRDKYACDHPKEYKKIVYIKDSLDRKLYCYQCQLCGAKVGDYISHKNLPKNEFQPFNKIIQTNYETARREDYRELHKFLVNQDLAKKRVLHKNYLLTPKWKEKRALVLKRCNGMCEGCQIKKAVIIHHLTYEHWGNEFLFELIGLCEDCNNRIHTDKITQGLN